MSYELKVLPIVQSDLVTISEYFDKETGNKEKADKFILEVDTKINSLIYDFNIYQVRYKNVRLSHLIKFKYSIHYILDEKRERIVVLAIFSMKENPEKWKKRFRQVFK